MESEALLVFAILGVTIVLFVLDRIRMDLVALLSLLALLLTGVLNVEEGLAGFADPVVILIAGLFVVGEGLFRTGVADSLGRLPLRLAGESPTLVLFWMMLMVALMSAFMSSTGTVAVMLPVVLGIARRFDLAPSRLLIPLATASLLGGMLTLIGTPPNIVVTNALESAGHRPFAFFSFAPVGLVVLTIGIAWFLTVGRRLLPDRRTEGGPMDATQPVRELADRYGVTSEIQRYRIMPLSELAPRKLANAGLRERFGVDVVDIVREKEVQKKRRLPIQRRDPSARRPLDSTLPESELRSGDMLYLKGEPAQLRVAAAELGLQAIADEENDTNALPVAVGMAEVLLTPRSSLIGRTLREARFRELFGVNVLALQRMGKRLEGAVGNHTLRFGDTLLVEGPWERIALLRNERRNFVVATAPEELEEALRPSSRAVMASAIMVAMMLAMTFNVVPAVTAVIAAALAMVLTGCVGVEGAYRSINWQSVVLIAAILPMATALDGSGGMALIVSAVTNLLGEAGPLAMLAGLYLLTTLMSQVISNTATAVLLAPIGISAAAALGVAPYPFMMGIALAASCSFATPIATPVNTLVVGPGNYQFGDFLRAGLPLQLLIFVAAMVALPLFFPF